MREHNWEEYKDLIAEYRDLGEVRFPHSKRGTLASMDAQIKALQAIVAQMKAYYNLEETDERHAKDR